MKKTITVYTLASNTDYGTEASVFTTERAAYLALLDHPALDLCDDDRNELVKVLNDKDADFDEALQPFKSDIDTFSVDMHSLEIDI